VWKLPDINCCDHSCYIKRIEKWKNYNNNMSVKLYLKLKLNFSKSNKKYSKIEKSLLLLGIQLLTKFENVMSTYVEYSDDCLYWCLPHWK